MPFFKKAWEDLSVACSQTSSMESISSAALFREAELNKLKRKVLFVGGTLIKQPPEIWRSIFVYLNPRDIFTVSLVCKRWFAIVNDIKFLTLLLSIRFPFLTIPQQNFRALKSLFCKTVCLEKFENAFEWFASKFSICLKFSGFVLTVTRNLCLQISKQNIKNSHFGTCQLQQGF